MAAPLNDNTLQTNINTPQPLGNNTAQTFNPALQNLFKPIERSALETNTSVIAKGDLIVFNYVNWKHDPYPLVIVTDHTLGARIRGLNLHYLTLEVVKSLLKANCGNKGFSYRNVQSNRYIVNAFRSYKWLGVRQLKKLDCNFLLRVIGAVRSFDPNEVSAIKETVQEQMQRQVNPKANTHPSIQEVPTVPVIGQDNVNNG